MKANGANICRPSCVLSAAWLQSAYSTRKRTPIPLETVHRFHSKVSSDSTRKRAPIPRESVHPISVSTD